MKSSSHTQLFTPQRLARARTICIAAIALFAAVCFGLAIVGEVLTKRTIDNDTGVDAEVSFSTRMKYLRRLHRSYIASIVLSALTVLLVLYLASEQIALNRARKAGRSGLPRRGLPMFWELIVLVLWWAGWLFLSQYITANKAVWHCGSYGMTQTFCNVNKADIAFLWTTYFFLVVLYTVIFAYCQSEARAGYKDVWWTSFGKYKEYAVRRSEQRAVSGVGAVGPEDHYV